MILAASAAKGRMDTALLNWTLSYWTPATANVHRLAPVRRIDLAHSCCSGHRCASVVPFPCAVSPPAPRKVMEPQMHTDARRCTVPRRGQLAIR